LLSPSVQKKKKKKERGMALREKAIRSPSDTIKAKRNRDRWDTTGNETGERQGVRGVREINGWDVCEK
jgi:hypothetical protein